MSRTHQEVVDALAEAARHVPFDAVGTWRDALFAAGPDGGWSLDTAGGPDRALLAALAEEIRLLDAHAEQVPGRLRLEWYARILRIGRLPLLPDRVVLRAEVDPALAPVVLPAGTVARGGKHADGQERRYRTTDALTAHGATVLGIRVLLPGGTAPGEPGVVLAPGPDPVPPGPTMLPGADAPHALRVSSDVLAFAAGDMTVRIHLVGADDAQVAALRAAGSWVHVRTDGTERDAGPGGRTGRSLDLHLSGGCADPAGGTPWIEWRLAAGSHVPESLALDRVEVEVRERTGVAPDAAYAGAGALDVTKEFQPFGPTAHRGDALYLRCDEALAKPLATLDVDLEIMPELSPGGAGAGMLGLTWASTGPHMAVTYAATAAVEESGYDLAGLLAQTVHLPMIHQLLSGAASLGGAPRISWQRRVDGAWREVTSTSGALRAISGVGMAGTGSEPTTVGGTPGRYVRAFLDGGDFGWTAYQRALQDFASRPVLGGGVTPELPLPPVPPTITRLTVGYTTSRVRADVVSRSGWRTRPLTGAAGRPFRRAADDAGRTGMVALGLALPDAALGGAVTVHVDLEPPEHDPGAGAPDARWEAWDGAGWQPLATTDGTRSLREPGLLRFVAPRAWPVGCPDVSAADGRWLRLVTRSPGLLGAVLGVTPDAVPAELVLPATGPEPDVGDALAPGTIKGLLTPVAGVRRVTNLAGVRGRPAESDAGYARRAAAEVRHRGRALTPWDHEQHVLLAHPEVAAVRCLPHTGPDGAHRPGSIALVVVPDRTDLPAPRPSVGLAERITDTLRPIGPPGARLAVLPPAYVPLAVTADVLLRPGVPALVGSAAVAATLDALLHPGRPPVRWGRSLYVSALVAALEHLPEVDVVRALAVRPAGATSAVQVVDVDPDRGLYCAGAAHDIRCEEQL